MLFLIKSDFIEHLFFLQISPTFIQTKPNPKKKFQIPENKLPEIYFAVDPCPPFSATNHKKSSHPPQFLFFILINNNNIKIFIHINIVVGDCGFLRVRYVLVMGSHKKSHPHPPSSSSSPSSSQPADVAISGKRFFFSFVFCYYSYVGFCKVSAFNLKHWFFVLVS